ncbi:hypothetical protein HPP92_021844 [Vanilla planifolia]|uniref:Pentatricopeptide repeat-containing protein n=1 Tax=Vanilla planifolia TaxID=51239 RepID=A0A835Q548_VANPL|nr:hypothetical protein HPP92_021844 [Vanilla planifolia]
MVPNGAFPDSRTYNLMLQYLIKSAKLQEVFVLLKEMVKNEFLPSPANCNSAMKMFIDFKDWDMAMKAWKIMADNGIVEEEVANSLVIGFETMAGRGGLN